MRRAVVALVACVVVGACSTPGRAQVDYPNHLFAPKLEWVKQWVNEGIDIAANDRKVFEWRGISRWIWYEHAGRTLVPNRAMRVCIVLTPQLVGTVAGWATAWDERVWARMWDEQKKEWNQGERERVVDRIANDIIADLDARRILDGDDLWMAIGTEVINNVASGPMLYYMYGGFKWYRLTVEPQGNIRDFSRKQPLNRPHPLWVARYVLALSLLGQNIGRPERIDMVIAKLHMHNPGPGDEMLTYVPSMHYFQQWDSRLAIGNRKDFGILEWDLASVPQR